MDSTAIFSIHWPWVVCIGLLAPTRSAYTPFIMDPISFISYVYHPAQYDRQQNTCPFNHSNQPTIVPAYQHRTGIIQVYPFS